MSYLQQLHLVLMLMLVLVLVIMVVVVVVLLLLLLWPAQLDCLIVSGASPAPCLASCVTGNRRMHLNNPQSFCVGLPAALLLLFLSAHPDCLLATYSCAWGWSESRPVLLRSVVGVGNSTTIHFCWSQTTNERNSADCCALSVLTLPAEELSLWCNLSLCPKL